MPLIIRKLVLFLCLISSAVKSQTVSLNDLRAFRSPSANWSIVGEATVDTNQNNVMTTKPGKGVLACIQLPGKAGLAYNLLTVIEHGDADVEVEFMMAKGSNSGVYLQGRYEVQLYDSWGAKQLHVYDVGSIYERWSEDRPSGQKGYEGHVARINAGKAPGVWQKLKISFQAPRFDAAGKKTANAKMLKVELNGILIHENVELFGTTRSSMEGEVAKGPLMLQGDHGSVAFRNLEIKFR
ncbi:MAG: DUF1080 domain-containing protein [Spirosomataceae bacterium]